MPPPPTRAHVVGKGTSHGGLDVHGAAWACTCGEMSSPGGSLSFLPGEVRAPGLPGAAVVSSGAVPKCPSCRFSFSVSLMSIGNHCQTRGRIRTGAVGQ